MLFVFVLRICVFGRGKVGIFLRFSQTMWCFRLFSFFWVLVFFVHFKQIRRGKMASLCEMWLIGMVFIFVFVIWELVNNLLKKYFLVEKLM